MSNISMETHKSVNQTAIRDIDDRTFHGPEI